MVVNTHRLFAQLLRVMRIDAVCDVGSMNGADALRFRAAAPAARIHAFEPNPENLQRMQTNPALRDNNINIVALAVTNYDGDAEFHIVPAGYFPGESWRGMSSLYERFDQPALSTTVRVKTARLDTFLARDVAPHQPQSARLFELAALLLQTQVQAFLTQVAFLGQQLIRAHLDNFLDFHDSLGRSHVMPAEKLGPHRQFVRRQSQRFARDRLGHAIQFE